MTESDHTKAAIYGSMKPNPSDKESSGSHPESLKATEEELNPKQRRSRKLREKQRGWAGRAVTCSDVQCEVVSSTQ